MAGPGTSWGVGAEFGAPEVWIEAGELAAYRLARMSARLVQGLSGGGADPERVWLTLAASCPIDFAISRSLAALGRTGPLRGHAIDVRSIRRIEAYAPVEAPCSLCVEATVTSRVALVDDSVVMGLAVLLTRNPDGARLASFELELRVVRRAAA